ncbi:PAQR family membrane homeostasis protein TrhA [Aquimarina intermedia]|uniref:Hemolysin III n=1 Tax=Aquimarina intermedia TaxID=350814 RepID=A0A5S5BSL5_9FLAO|nr:hemolysin III family protein [Aquimarina intermedia]TYP69924.1 hemolysin III [Aquimarina intermedia]
MLNQSIIEETWNWRTHGLGFLLSLLGAYLLLQSADLHDDKVFFSIVIYSISLSLLYLVSFLYHYTRNSKHKQNLRILDHISIYVLIAGTYSPVTLITISDGYGLEIFIAVWTLALLGSCLKIFYTGRFEIISLLLYLIMGWLIVFDISNLIGKVGMEGLLMLLAGGLVYSLGIIFYVKEKMWFNHVIWHLFVMGGSFLHYLFIYQYVVK